MDPPYCLPSATEVAKRCFYKYKYRLDLGANCDLTDAKIPPAPVGVPRVVATA